MRDRNIAPSQENPWSEIHAMLQRVRAGFEQSPDSLSSADEEILRRRAREYARSGETGCNVEQDLQDVLLFSLGNRNYAVPCSMIEEVLPMQNLVALPQTNRAILGISSHRGVLFAVVDIKRVLHIPASDLTTMHRVVMLRHEKVHIGILVDGVQGMDSFDLSRLRDLPRELSEQTRRFLRGVSENEVLLVDAVALLRAMTATEAGNGRGVNV